LDAFLREVAVRDWGRTRPIARHPRGPPSLAAEGFDMDDALYARITALSQTPPPATDRLEEA